MSDDLITNAKANMNNKNIKNLKNEINQSF
jgi:hypothetical protein